jgi:hypothetical protein
MREAVNSGPLTQPFKVIDVNYELGVNYVLDSLSDVMGSDLSSVTGGPERVLYLLLRSENNLPDVSIAEEHESANIRWLKAPTG